MRAEGSAEGPGWDGSVESEGTAASRTPGTNQVKFGTMESKTTDSRHWNDDSRPFGTVWALSDGRAGNSRQAEALARAVAGPGGEVRTLVLAPRAPWRWWAPRLLPGSGRAFGAGLDALLAAPPALAIGCGRHAALATRLLRSRGTRVVQILDPRLDPRHWDLVVVPAHDALRGANVLPMQGSVHPVDDAWLAAARAAHPAIGQPPSPRMAVLVGGIALSEFAAFADGVDALSASDGARMFATASRRTPGDVVAAMRARWGAAGGGVYAPGDPGANPYPGLLAWADRIACTADSVNMLSEACATHAPVWVGALEGARARPRAHVRALLEDGRIGELGGTPPRHATPVRDTARVAVEIRTRLFGAPDA